MKKSKKNQEKDKQRTSGKIWKDKPTPYSKRRSGSGVTSGGRYEDEKR